MKKPATCALAALGTASMAYYVTLKVTDPGPVLSFSLVWPLFGFGTWIWFFASAMISRYIRKKVLTSELRIVAARGVCASIAAVSGIFLAIILFPCTPGAEAAAGQTPESPEYLIVLGGGLRRNGNPTTTLESRLRKAAEVYRENTGLTLVVTGGKLPDTPLAEADAMARYLVEREGIPAEAILREPKARDTIENFNLSRDLILLDEAVIHPGRDMEKDAPRVALLTSGYHMNRSLFLARRAGFRPTGVFRVPCPPLQAPNGYLREVAAYWKLSLRLIGKAITGS